MAIDKLKQKMKTMKELEAEVIAIETFLDTRHKCWNRMKVGLVNPKKRSRKNPDNILLLTEYGIYFCEIEASSRLSEAIADVLSRELSMLRREMAAFLGDDQEAADAP